MTTEKFQATTIDAAIQKGLDKYQVERSMVEIEIIQRDRKGFMGIGAKDAIVAMRLVETPESSDSSQASHTAGEVNRIPVEDSLGGDTAVEETELDKSAHADDKIISKIDENSDSQTETEGVDFVAAKELESVSSDELTKEESDSQTDQVSEAAEGVVAPEEGQLKETKADTGLPVSNAVPGELDGPDKAASGLEANPAESTVATQNDLNSEVQAETITSQSATGLASNVANNETTDLASQEADDLDSSQNNEEEEEMATPDSEVENIEKVARYLMDVCDAYLAPITVDVEDYGNEIIYHLNTDKPGLVIGKHGKIINSLETLAKVLTHRHVRNRVIVSVNVGDYRERRQETLEHLAQRTADEVTETQQSIALDPLPASERKIIHSQLAKYPHIKTSSQGREPHRYLVVKYKG
ncbi:RNA-binding cell elongation regulator Jag/EloR [Aerococcus kribbianus]|uniref:RNA-binding protein KhpB n=1 Tax=Aerococcus kribbianus TaxID=2999064 RepID=A0A9X3FN41_9LACT|nr:MULTISPECIES: RNA-binding cell elongation regulator Jag/EloR [unclassified Aerococcus]MCZ0717582.1 Jag N-terminal domain-containing protein [Aerococcus sp. YH-aer221]MCZ0725870.1 Jag N-terminal domain-containing protein [Aerococcus sp. YH-aer222]